MSFTDAEKVDIRRHCGYSFFGSQNNPNYGFFYFTWYGLIEYKMNNLAPQEETVVRNVYLSRLSTLETEIFDQTSQNADTDRAAVWDHNKKEQRDREDLYLSLRLKLCRAFGVPFGESIMTGAGMPGGSSGGGMVV